MRWRLKLEEYEYDIEYTKGKDNTAADALSRVRVITRQEELTNKFNDWEKDDQLPKRLKIVPNKNNFYQITKGYLGNYDKAIWLDKLNEVLEYNDKVGIGDNNFTENQRRTP